MEKKKFKYSKMSRKNVHFREHGLESRIAVGKAEGRGMVFMQIEISPELELADCGDKLFQISERSAAPWLAAINQIKLRLKTVLIMQTSGEPEPGPSQPTLSYKHGREIGKFIQSRTYFCSLIRLLISIIDNIYLCCFQIYFYLSHSYYFSTLV